MVNKLDVDAEQDMSDTSTLPETPNTYEPVLPKIRGAPTNYLVMSKEGVAIEGQYLIDLSVPPPPPFVSGGIAVTRNDERSHYCQCFSPAHEERTAPISDVQGVRVYFVGDRPRSGPWGGNNDKQAEGASPKEPLDQLFVGGENTSVQINWDGELELPQMCDS
ncbi:hypothetical protein EDB87DRAFT_1828148 [Lactarius vividus]|nr:hypothetical protein EDB87DRAFT_1828148 [Lactarius vividus]